LSNIEQEVSKTLERFHDAPATVSVFSWCEMKLAATLLLLAVVFFTVRQIFRQKR